MKRVAGMVAAAVAGALVAVALSSADVGLPPMVTFPDAIGDSGAAPDLTRLSFGRDANQLLTFQVGVGNRQAVNRGEQIFVLFDTDLDVETGAGGAEYVLVYDGGFWAYDARSGSLVPASPASFHGSWSAGVATFQISAADAGVRTLFAYRAMSVLSDPLTYDNIPEGPLFEFRGDLSAPLPPTPPTTTARAQVRPRLVSAAARWRLSTTTLRVTVCDESAGHALLHVVIRKGVEKSLGITQRRGCHAYSVAWRATKRPSLPLALTFYDADGLASATKRVPVR